MQSPPGPQSSPPSSHDDARGEDFDISTLPASSGATGQGLRATRWNRAWMVLAGLLAAYCLYFFAYGMGASSQNPLPLPINTSSGTSAPHSSATVHVAGAVVRPGVYSVNANARISDAIAQAGGLTADAETTSLNLADFVRDGSQIVVPVRAAASINAIVAPPGVSAPPTDTPSIPSNGLPATTATTSPNAAARDAQIAYFRAHPIDLNSASSFELQQLPGIGPSRAQEIIDYRTKNGLFRSVSDLDNVKGIGEKRMEVLKDLVVVR